MATAIVVFSRLWLWGEVSPRRDRHLIWRLMQKVAQAAASTAQPVLLAVDGFAAYPKVIVRAFQTKVHTGKPGPTAPSDVAESQHRSSHQTPSGAHAHPR